MTHASSRAEPASVAATPATKALQTELQRWVRAMTMRIPLPTGESVERSAYAAMFQLHSSGPTRASDLAAELGLDLSTVSRQMSGLTRQGYVQKIADPGDGRASLLVLTDAGQRVIEEGAAARRDFLGDLLATWSEQDIHMLAALLSRFNDEVARRRERGVRDPNADTASRRSA